MFTDEEIEEIWATEERERQIDEDIAREEVLDAETLLYHDEGLLYERLPQEAFECYCVPERWTGRRGYNEY